LDLLGSILKKEKKKKHEVALCGRSGPGWAFNGTVRWRVEQDMRGRYGEMEEFIVL
jgi:hypothetical protein